jgi:hypothetical protein
MKTIIIIIAVMVLTGSASGSPIIIHIDNVEITPEAPTILDIININVSGGASGAGSLVEYSEFSQDRTTLQLDLFLDFGPLAMPSTWSHLEQVGPFTADSYSLTVRAFEYQDGTFKESYAQDFNVTPEPTSILFISSGIIGIRLLRRKNS